MALRKNRIAMVSPSHNAYSETFIQAQKNGLNGTVFYYYDGHLPKYLEKKGVLLSKNIYKKNRIARKFGLTSFNAEEAAFINSLKINKIDVVLAQYGTTAHRIIKLIKHLEIPLITHFHGYDASINAIITSCNNYKEVFNHSSYVIAVSNVMKNSLIELGCPSQKIIYNVYGPNDIFLKVKPNFRKFQFISIGRFVDKKAPYYLISAFIKVLDKYPETKIIMAGEGELLNACRNLVKYYGIKKNIEFPGVISPEKYSEYLGESLAMVQHSIMSDNGDSEGTPLAILEASAAGLPVISTKHAGIPDVIINGKTGLLVEEHDVDGMAENMLKLLENPELAKKMGAKGKINIEQNFNMERHIKLLDELIDKAVKANCKD